MSGAGIDLLRRKIDSETGKRNGRAASGRAASGRGGSASGRARQAGPDPHRPSAALFLTEPARGLVDLTALLVAAPWLATAPRGDGHGVLALPGLLASDTSTLALRGFLSWLGYDVRGWDLGRNRGPTEEVLAGMPQAILAHAERTGRPVSLVGWSLGGIYAREMVRRHSPADPAGHYPRQSLRPA